MQTRFITQNRIRAIRIERGLSQRQLAEVAGTNQAQIQRIEAGVQAARLDLAARICNALGQPMDQVFPATKKTLARLRRENGTWEDFRTKKEYEEKMEEAGIDMDVEVWTLKFRLRGGKEGFWSISGIARKRLWRVFQESDPIRQFVVFDSDDKRVAVNPQHLLFWQFLWDAPSGQLPDDEKGEEGENHDCLSIFFAEGGEPLEFEIDGDSERYTGKDETLDGERSVQLQEMFVMLDMGGMDKDDVLNFEDVDGECVFFRPAEVSLIEVPLWAVEPELDSSDEAGEAAPTGASPVQIQ